MRKTRRFIRIFLAALFLASSISSLTSAASEAADSTAARTYETLYTVRILPGAAGTLPGGILVYENMHYGDTISFDINSVTVTEGKYYVKGLKDSGMDPNHPTSDFRDSTYLVRNGSVWTITVTRDQDFVVTYGLAGSSVAYTVNYLDADGNILLPSNTYYGNVGEPAIVSYIYIDGYVPRDDNPQFILTEYAENNTINYIYDRIAVVEPEPEPQPVTPVQPEAEPFNPEQPVNPVNPEQPVNPVNPGGEAQPEPQVQPGGDIIPEGQPESDGLVDFEDYNVPLAYSEGITTTEYGFKLPGLEYDGSEEFDDYGTPLASNMFMIANDYLMFMYVYDIPEFTGRTAFAGDLADAFAVAEAEAEAVVAEAE